jgi:hypothetical protein
MFETDMRLNIVEIYLFYKNGAALQHWLYDMFKADMWKGKLILIYLKYLKSQNDETVNNCSEKFDYFLLLSSLKCRITVFKYV